VRVDHPFSFLAAALSSSFLYLFASFSRDYARLCEKNRKSWPALQHYFIFLFVTVFSRSSGLRSFLLRLSSPSISSWSNGLSATLRNDELPF